MSDAAVVSDAGPLPEAEGTTAEAEPLRPPGAPAPGSGAPTSTGTEAAATAVAAPDVTPVDDAVLMEEPPKSRAEMRKAQKKQKKRRHRWRRRIIYSMVFIVLLAAGGAGGIYVYASYRFHQIKKIHAKHLVTQPADPLAPFTMLLVGSDSRAFVDNSTQVRAFGNESDAGGQRSDVMMVVRFDPATKTVTVLSIPRDLWVDIPGNESGISGMNRINAAFNSGPDLLVQTIEQDLGITVNHYASVSFPGFQGMVDALGGVDMDFPTAVKDQYTGLYVTQTGCQSINGTTSLQLVRSRHLYYMNANGYWTYDGLSDFSRIQRQDAFFRAVLQKVNESDTNPLAINGFISAAVGNLTIDDTLTQGELLHIAETFKGLPSSNLITETLPTTSLVTDGGADVLQAAEPYAQNMINSFNAIGSTPPTTTTTSSPTSKGKGKGATTSTTTTTAPGVAHSDISVNVLNAGAANGVAHSTAAALTDQGFKINEIGNSSESTPDGESQILYGSTGYAAAQSLGAVLSGPVTYAPDSALSGNTLSLLVAGSSLRVGTGSTTTTSSTSTTTTTYPGEPTTTTTIPGNVYTNTQLEPWNPYPCTLGAPPTTTTTTTAKKATSKK